MNQLRCGSLETLDQMIGFIGGLTEDDYQYQASPWFESSIGQHLRHIADLYLAIHRDVEGEIIDYDSRRRGALIETRRQAGLQELDCIRQWLLQLDESSFSRTVTINTEVCLSRQHSEKLVSTLGRELCFAASHLTHHLALMVVIAKMAGKSVDPRLGVAPATASYTRQQDATLCAH